MSNPLKFRVEGEAVQDYIDGVINKLRNFGSLFKKIAQKEIDYAQERIAETKKDPDGVPWEDWKPSTRAGRERDGTASLGLLLRSGELYDSFETKIANKSLTIYNNKEYAKYLQDGTENMPARPFVGWSRESRNNIEDLISAQYIRPANKVKVKKVK